MMTYDVLTRRPEPVFGFLVGRLKLLGVPARDEAREPPGARSGRNSSRVGELSSSDSSWYLCLVSLLLLRRRTLGGRFDAVTAMDSPPSDADSSSGGCGVCT